MTLEITILVISYLFTIFSLWYWVPRKKIRDAWLIFLFMQLITWLVGIFSVEKGWLQYPVREFPKATQQSFAFEFFAYPSICIFFCLYYPEQKKWYYQVGYYLLYTGAVTLIEVLLEHYTDLIEYTGWQWYWTALTIPLTLFLAHLYYRWYSKYLIHQEVAR